MKNGDSPQLKSDFLSSQFFDFFDNEIFSYEESGYFFIIQINTQSIVNSVFTYVL